MNMHAVFRIFALIFYDKMKLYVGVNVYEKLLKLSLIIKEI